MSQGILLVATHDPEYARMACECAMSLRAAGGHDGQIAVLTDLGEAAFPCGNEARLDILPVQTPIEGPYSSRFVKTSLNVLTPFDDTLFVDADVVAMAGVAELWPRLDEASIWMAKDPHSDFPPGITPTRPRWVPYYNSGVILWRKSELADKLFSAWHLEWMAGDRTSDQKRLVEAMTLTAIIPTELPQEFNSRSGSVLRHRFGEGPRRAGVARQPKRKRKQR